MYNHLLYCSCILQYGQLIHLAWRLESLGTTRSIPFLNRRRAVESPEVCRLRLECKYVNGRTAAFVNWITCTDVFEKKKKTIKAEWNITV